MLIFELLRKIEELTGLSRTELTPVKFGFDVEWEAAGEYLLAQQNVPNQQFLIVCRVECYTTNLNAGATDPLLHQATPPGKAFWFGTANSAYTFAEGSPLTETNADAHLILDTDDLLLLPGNQYADLIGNLEATPDADTRNIRTTVYGFFAPTEFYASLRNQLTWANQSS